jgi:hypothetical protein
MKKLVLVALLSSATMIGSAYAADKVENKPSLVFSPEYLKYAK